MDNKKYDGWANYATWRVNLEIIDEYINYVVYEDKDPSWAEMSKSDLADVLEEYADDVITNFGGTSDDFNSETGFVISYARAFLNDVDWYELAEHAQNTIKEAKEYEEQNK